MDICSYVHIFGSIAENLQLPAGICSHFADGITRDGLPGCSGQVVPSMVLPLTATGRPEVAGGLSLLVLFALTPQVLPLEEEGNPVKMPAEAFNVRLEEPTVIDMAFLATSGGTSAAAGSSAAAAAGAKPVLALLYEDSKQARHIQTYTLNLKTRVRYAGRLAGAPSASV